MSRGKDPVRGKSKTKAGPKARAAVKSQERPAKSRRTRAPMSDSGLRSASFVFRHRVGNAVIFLVLIVAAAQLFNLQVPRAEGLRAEAASQLKVTDVEQGGARRDRRPQQRQAGVHHRGTRADVPAGQDAQATGRGAARRRLRRRIRKRRLRDIAAEVATRLNNKPDAADGAEEAQEQRVVRLPRPRGRSGRRRRDHHEVPRGRLRAPGSAPVSGRDRWRPTSSAASTGTATACWDSRIRWTPCWPAPTGRSPTTAAPTAW